MCHLIIVILSSSFIFIISRFAFITTPCKLTKNAVNILVLSLRVELKTVEEWLQREIEEEDHQKELQILLIQRIRHKCQKGSLELISEIRIIRPEPIMFQKNNVKEEYKKRSIMRKMYLWEVDPFFGS